MALKLELFNQDCMEKMELMEENSVDYVITSPPYNMNLRIRGGKYCSRQVVKEFSTKYEGYSDNLAMEDYFKFSKNVISELLRITKHQVFYNIQPITGNKRALWELIGYFSKNIKEIIVWDKISAQPAIAEKVLNSQYEFIIVLSKNNNDSISRQYKNASFNRGTMSTLWKIGRSVSKKNNHKATSPVALIDNIVLNFTKKGDTIFDPFLGTGSMGESALKNGRNFIGTELLQDYYDFAKKRLEKFI